MIIHVNALASLQSCKCDAQEQLQKSNGSRVAIVQTCGKEINFDHSNNGTYNGSFPSFLLLGWSGSATVNNLLTQHQTTASTSSISITTNILDFAGRQQRVLVTRRKVPHLHSK